MTIPYILAMLIYVVACSATLTSLYGVRWSGSTRGFTQTMVFQSLMPVMGFTFASISAGWIVVGVIAALVIVWFSCNIQEHGANIILHANPNTKEHLLVEAYVTLANVVSMFALVLVGYIVNIMVV